MPDLRPEPVDRSRGLIFDALSGYARDVVEAVVFLLVTPLLISVLGLEQYGIWSLLWAVLGVLNLLALGLGPSVVKFVADARGRGDVGRHGRVVATLFWMYVGVGIVLLACAIPLGLRLGSWFDLPADLHPVVAGALIVLALRAVLILALDTFRGVLIGHGLLRVVHALWIPSHLGYLLAAFLVLPRWGDLRVVAALSLAAAVLPMLAMAARARRLPGVSVAPRFVDRGIMRELGGFSACFLIVQVSLVLATRCDAFVIGGALGLEAVGLYALAMRLSEKAGQFCGHIQKALTPVAAEYHGAGRAEELQRLWLDGARFATAFATPLLVGAILLAEPLLVAWAGPSFAAAAPALQWLLAATLVGVAHCSTHNVLGMGGQHRYLAGALLVAQIANVALSLLFVRTWGISGVAAATLAGTAPVQVFWIQRHAARQLGIGRVTFYRRALGPSLLPGLAMTLMLLALSEAVSLDAVWKIALAEFLAVALFWGLFWRSGLTTAERERILALLRRTRASEAVA